MAEVSTSKKSCRSISRGRGEKPKDKKRNKSPFPRKKSRARKLSDSDRGSETKRDSEQESVTEGNESSPERTDRSSRARRTKTNSENSGPSRLFNDDDNGIKELNAKLERRGMLKSSKIRRVKILKGTALSQHLIKCLRNRMR